MLDGSHYFECKCDSIEHTMRFVIDKEDKEMYIDVHLNQYRRWYETLWVGIKYIFGYKCKYGHWDVTMLKDEDILRLRDLCNDLLDITTPKEKDMPEESHKYPANLPADVVCGVANCTNVATHTWSGHPTCNACATPVSGRTTLPDREVGVDE